MCVWVCFGYDLNILKLLQQILEKESRSASAMI